MSKSTLRSVCALARTHRVTEGRSFRLRGVDPDDTGGAGGREKAGAALILGTAELSAMQEKLYAQDRWALLLIFQAMDAAGKDGTIKHVMSGVNPQGCQVYSFKAPSVEELDHDFLWRTTRCLPERGRIGIFNRSYYEEVLVARVHPELLDRQRIPSRPLGGKVWDARYEDIGAFERYLSRNGVAIVKFFLHISKEEQERRFRERLDRREKNWKFSLADVQERHFWDDYMKVYEQMVRRTAAPWAPWYVVPADHKWHARLVVIGAILDVLKGLDLAFPKVDARKKEELSAARAALREEGRRTGRP